MRKGIPVFAVAVAAVMGCHSAQAQDAEGEEQPRVRIVSEMRHQYFEFPFLDGSVVGGRVEGTYTVVESALPLMAEGATGDIICLTQAVTLSGRLGIIAPCTMTVSNGNTWSVIAARVAGDIGTGGGGVGEINIAGGTGAFAGISGNGLYDAKYSEIDPSEVQISMDLEFENWPGRSPDG